MLNRGNSFRQEKATFCEVKVREVRYATDLETSSSKDEVGKRKSHAGVSGEVSGFAAGMSWMTQFGGQTSECGSGAIGSGA